MFYDIAQWKMSRIYFYLNAKWPLIKIMRDGLFASFIRQNENNFANQKYILKNN